MSTPEAFLSALWNDQQDGFYFIAMPNPNGEGFRHFGFKTAADAALFVDDRVDAGLELYFALAKYREIHVMVGDKRRQRVASNVLSVGALWLDLDVGSEPHKYQSKKQAIDHLVAFCKAVKLPKPTVVDSGGGVHVYWVLRKHLAPERWQILAGWLKAVAAHWGLKQDNSRTSDIASVLRVPGTYNHKRDERRPVQLLNEIRICAAKELAAPLGVYFEQKQLTLLPGRNIAPALDGAPPPGSLSAASGITSQFGQVAQAGIVKYDPIDIDVVADHCQQMDAILRCGGNVPEPLWYAAIGLACFTSREDDIHYVSDGHPGYTEEATEAKAAQWRASVTGPATCARFESANPAGCQGCQHYGKITTPAQLGRAVSEVREPHVPSTPKHIAAHSSFPAVYNDKGEQIGIVAPCPQGWRRVAAGIEKAVKGKDGALEWVLVVIGLDILPINWVYDPAKGATMLTRFTTSLGMTHDLMIDVASLIGSQGIGPIFSRLCLFVSSAQQTAAKDYLVAYMQSLRDAQHNEEVRRQLGWQADNSFVLPEVVFYPDGRVVASRPDETNAAIFSAFEPKGDESAWKHALELYNRPGAEPYAFAGLSGLASTLMRFTPYHGVTLSLFGPSGVGKTTIQKLVMGAWGDPSDSKMSTVRDTKKSREQRMGVTNSLPLCLNEASNMDAMDASAVVYATTEGTFGTALTQNRRQNTDPSDWSMVTVWSLNRSLRSLLAQGKADTEAESLRVFEYEIKYAVGVKEEIDAAYQELGRSYGAAGRVFIKYVVNHLDEVEQMVHDNIRKIEQQAAATVQERYWVALIAVILAANQIARKVGLSNIATSTLAKFGISTMVRNRSTTAVSRIDSVGMLSRYLTEHATGILSVAQNLTTGQLSVLDMPRSALVATLFPSSGVMLVDRGAFARWCNKAKVDADAILGELHRLGVVTRDGLKASLGAGISSIVTGVSTVFEVDCQHRAMVSSHAVNRPGLKVVA